MKENPTAEAVIKIADYFKKLSGKWTAPTTPVSDFSDHPKDHNFTGWQSCPHCNGRGFAIDGYTYHENTCPVCNGKRIINRVTGKPPKD